MTMVGSSFSVTTTAVLLIGSSTHRVRAEIHNTGSATAYLGFTSSVNSGLGFPLFGGEKLKENLTKGLDWYGITGASDTTTVKVIEQTVTNAN